ncbi:uncharacterized protein LOC121241454 [Juglans microcarpa x Juglans regia]|uniref:uncharacterized protein LOC121241454 n=1 Tax=Juglans microcarpa x Juglans regia TaxID=2249226 RepID=UPI001B7EA9B8|nr:uncharacterized protein LOC121241454 [Juglans microcarpa x Juglans regia]
METKSAAFSAAVPVPELLDKHNYPEWEIRVRTYLTGQDLWKDIIDDNPENATAAPSWQENDDEELRRRNYMALHVIQISCGPDAFFEIKNLRSADRAWQTLKEKYLVPDTVDSSYLQYAELYKAVLCGDLTAAKDFLDSHDMAVSTAITDKGETALHIAATAGHALIVKELVNRMSEADLKTPDSDGYTALMTAVVHGRYQLAKWMLDQDKGRNLISIRDTRRGNLPVAMAIDFGQIEMARYLYPLTSLNDLKPAERNHNGAKLLTRAIYTRNLDLALHLIRRCPPLTLALDDRDESPFLALASMRHAFRSGNRLVFWKRWIYSRIRIDQSAPATFETRLNIPNVENGRQPNQVTTIGSVPSLLLRHLVSVVRDFFGINQLYEMKKIHIQSNELLSCMCGEISRSQTRELASGGVYDAINRAVMNGIFEFVLTIVRTNPRFLENEDRNLRNIFMLAVLYRQSEIFSLIYGLDMKNTLTSYGDCNDDNMLHMAGMIEDSTRLDRSSGAALQMQRELQWFKEVERIVNPKIKEGINKDGLTPRQLFTKNHENMMENGEKWMKDTASSCTVVGALIVTIMFAVAFTVPGGNDQTTGFPIFLKKKLFKLFIIFDALSLFSSSTSVLMFLGILTSRYAEKDFLEYLPRQMIIGLLTLFCSIVTMMIAFSAALLIILHEQQRIAIPLVCLAGVPVTFFVWIQFPILKDMIKSTYFLGIFNKKMKLDFK